MFVPYLHFDYDTYVFYLIIISFHKCDIIVCMQTWSSRCLRIWSTHSEVTTWVISSDLEGYYSILLHHISNLNKEMLAIFVDCNIPWGFSWKCFRLFQQIKSMTACHESQKPSRAPYCPLGEHYKNKLFFFSTKDGKQILFLTQKVCTYFPDKSVTWTNVSLKEAKICATAKICSPSLAWNYKNKALIRATIHAWELKMAASFLSCDMLHWSEKKLGIHRGKPVILVFLRISFHILNNSGIGTHRTWGPREMFCSWPACFWPFLGAILFKLRKK